MNKHRRPGGRALGPARQGLIVGDAKMSKHPTIEVISIRALLDTIAQCPQGIALSALRAELAIGSSATFDDMVLQAIATGSIEMSPIYLDRLRCAQPVGSDEAAAWVRLRDQARPFLADIHRVSGLPVTLHVLIGRAHAVIERFPADEAETIIEEVARYTTPRPLTSGNTSKVFLACLPLGIPEASSLSDSERSSIREAGYSYALAAEAALGCVMTAPVRDGAGTAFAALCTFGTVDILPPENAPTVARAMAAAAGQLAAIVEADWPLLRRSGEDLSHSPEELDP